MKKLLACVLAAILMLTLAGCGGASQEKIDSMIDRYNVLKESFETCGSTLYNLGVTADSELGLAYSDWGDAITGLANEINKNANRMGQEDVDSMVSRMSEMLDDIEETQVELDAMIDAIDITGRWHYEDESGVYVCFYQGKATVYSAEGDLIDQGTYTQKGIFVELETEQVSTAGVTDGASILFGEGEDAFILSFECLTIE